MNSCSSLTGISSGFHVSFSLARNSLNNFQFYEVSIFLFLKEGFYLSFRELHESTAHHDSPLTVQTTTRKWEMMSSISLVVGYGKDANRILDVVSYEF